MKDDSEAGIWPIMRPMWMAPLDGTPILVKVADDLPARSDGMPRDVAGIVAVLRNRGDVGDWSFAAPVGYGGIPTAWLDGWWPLPAGRAALEEG